MNKKNTNKTNKKQDKKRSAPLYNKVLICGGAGYIGGYLTDLLIQNEYDITVYDNLTYEEQYRKNVNFIFGDVRDKEKLSHLVPDFDSIIWLAALVGDSACDINHSVTTEVNLSSVEWLVKNYNGKILFMSTCSVYGSDNNLVDESAKPNPLSHYAQTKLEAERIITKHSKNHLVFRLGTLFGISDDHSRIRLDLVVKALTKKAALGEPLLVFGGGQWRPLLHVKDVAEAVLFGLKNDINGLFNLSNGNYRICDIAREIKKIVPNVKIEFINEKFEDLRNYRATSKKFLSYGWKPKYSVEYGIREILQIIKERRIKEPDNILYSNVAYLKDKII